MKPKRAGASPAPKIIRPAPIKGKKSAGLHVLKNTPLVGMDIVTALRDPNLLGYSIKDLDTYQAWLAAAKAAFGLRMNKAELALFQQCAQRTDPPTKQFKRILLICGRRSGKSFLQAAIAVWLAIFRDYSEHLSKGEKATIFVIAADRKQARTIMRYIGGFLEAPMLKQYLVKEVAEAFELVNNVVIEVATASYKAVRGYTLAGVLADESAFWTDEDGRNPCSEIFAAVTPGLLTIPGAPLIISTTPMRKRGYVGEMYDAAFGDNANDHALVWQAPSLTMNPTLDKTEIDLEYKLDPIKAAAEYGAQFRNDVDALLAPEVIDRATPPERYELPYDDTKYYVAAIDASGGSSDSFTLAICHRQGDTGILDLIREVKPPFSPDAVCADFADCMRRYGVSTAWADRYALGWVEEGFKRHSVLIEHSDMDRAAING